jgi:hypothetical protein
VPNVLEIWASPKQNARSTDTLQVSQANAFPISTQIVTFKVRYDGQGATPENAKTAVAPDGNAVPAIGETVVTASGDIQTVSRVDARMDPDSPNCILVEVETSNDYPKPKPTGDKWNPDVKVSGVAFRETTNQDRKGNIICNSAGDPFPLSIEKTTYDEKITIGFNTFSVDVGPIGDARGKVNSDTVTLNLQIGPEGQQIAYSRSFPPNTLKLDTVDYSVVYAGKSTYFKVDISMIYREDDWTRAIVDQGFRELDVSGKPVEILDDHGGKLAVPAYLDGTGGQLPITPGVPTEAELVYFDIEGQAAFTPLFAGLGE